MSIKQLYNWKYSIFTTVVSFDNFFLFAANNSKFMYKKITSFEYH